MNRYRDWLEQAERDLSRADIDAHYIAARYPNGFPEGKPADYYNARKAKEAVDAASAIIRFCKHHLH
jgi:HEPN domain-containing protein